MIPHRHEHIKPPYHRPNVDLEIQFPKMQTSLWHWKAQGACLRIGIVLATDDFWESVCSYKLCLGLGKQVYPN
jgi:hypothetical protein